MTFKLMDLPYSLDALAPFMSKETLEYHYQKHHQTYVTNLNNLLEDPKNGIFKAKTLDVIVTESYNKVDFAGVFNNAAQAYNHNEFWLSMKKDSNPNIPSLVTKQIIKSFGSFDTFKDTMIKLGTAQFGSGWVWLLVENRQLVIKNYPNGVNPISQNAKEVLGCDVWEHSYYIDYRNKRADYLKAWFENLINWEYVEHKLNVALQD